MGKRAYRQRRHTKRRFMQRFRYELSNEEYYEIVSMIQKKECKLLSIESVMRSKWLIKYSDMIFVGVFDSGNERLVTILTPTKFEISQKGLTC